MVDTSLSSRRPESNWMRWALVVAAIYNVAWGGFIVLFPNALFKWAGLELPQYPELWQCVGMIVGVYGIGYLISATRPYRHWPIVLVGLLGKVFGPIGFIQALMNESFNLRFGLVIVTNDLIWWVPFGLILYGAYSHWSSNTVTSISADKMT